MQTFAINTDDDRPVKTEHVSFFAERNDKTVTLREVVRNTYKHPSIPEDATISVLEIVTLFSEKIGTGKAAAIELVELTDKNANSIKSSFYSK